MDRQGRVESKEGRMGDSMDPMYLKKLSSPVAA